MTTIQEKILIKNNYEKMEENKEYYKIYNLDEIYNLDFDMVELADIVDEAYSDDMDMYDIYYTIYFNNDCCYMYLSTECQLNPLGGEPILLGYDETLELIKNEKVIKE